MSDMARTSSSEPTLPGQPSAVSGHPFTRGQLALFAGGSGDHNAIHIDSDVAKAKGFGDVIVPGMLVMAQLGKMLTDWAGPSSVRRWNVRFTNIAPVLATPTYFAEVQEQTNVDGEPCLRLALWVVAEGGGEVVRGEARIDRASCRERVGQYV